MSRVKLPESKAGMAKRKGVTRGAVSLATRPGGALYEALMGGGCIDRSHPAALRWLREAHMDDAPTVEEVAERTGVPVDELRRALEAELSAAVVPAGHVGLRTFARLAGVNSMRLEWDWSRLRPALTSSCYIDVGHPVALAYLADHPFPRGPNGEPVLPDDFPAIPTAGSEDEILIDHPITRAFLARCNGRVMTDGELGLTP